MVGHLLIDATECQVGIRAVSSELVERSTDRLMAAQGGSVT
jgi:hypothetical protein